MKRFLAPILLLTLLFPTFSFGGEVKIPKNAYAQGVNWYCHNGFKADRVNNKCAEMKEEEKRIQLLQIQARRQQERNQTLEYDGENFTLRQIEKKCEIYRYSENYGELECRGFRFIERKCKAYFSDRTDGMGVINIYKYSLHNRETIT
tara:strand:+ start:379 stop:822 length:444 start_codon:yes stop_codon:yes gene_type:complete